MDACARRPSRSKKNKHFLVIIDSYSKYPDFYPVKTLKSTETEEKLRECFSRMGLPKTLVTDNGRSFTAQNIETFLKRNGIQHLTISPNHPMSNGQAENLVKTFKNKLKPVLEDPKSKNTDINTLTYRFLSNYRNTEHSSTKITPYQIMFGRQMRTRYDLLKNSQKSSNSENIVKSNLVKAQENQSKYFKTKGLRCF